MEVMSIGHSLGLRFSGNPQLHTKLGQSEDQLLRQIPVLLKNACLVHDIGNPPFGHFGETIIKDFFSNFFAESEDILGLTSVEKEDFTLFDGNAQGLRVLTKLQVLDNDCGLNLTFATLGTFLKYPNYGNVDEKTLSQSKRGVFQSEKSFFERIAKGCGLENGSIFKRHPLSFLMEAADSICYLTMDIEDGYNTGWYNYENIKQFLKDEVPDTADEFARLEKKHKTFGAEIARIVALRIYLIKRLVDLAMENFITNFDSICEGNYEKELIFDDPTLLAKKLKAFCKKEIFPRRSIQSLELTGHSVMTGLLNYFTEYIFYKNNSYKRKAFSLLSGSVVRAALIENKLPGLNLFDEFITLSNYYKLRVIVDHISGMTDQFALNEYQKLSGQKIN